MRRKNWIKVLAALIIIAVFTSVTIVSIADFGDFSGDSDYGDWDDDDDWGSGWDDDDDWGSGWDDDDDDDYDHRRSSGSGDQSVSLGSLIFEAVIVIGLSTGFALFMYWLHKDDHKTKKEDEKLRQIKETEAAEKRERLRTSESAWKTMESYKNVDAAFDEKQLIDYISDLYIRMQKCWAAKDISSLRPYFTDVQFAQYERQLENNYINPGLTSHLENVTVHNVTLKGWRVMGSEDQIAATIQASFVNYITYDATGRIVRGSRTAEKYMTYAWLLSRNRDAVNSDESSGTRTICCPHCNAPLEINKTARCEYCGSIVSVDSVDWVISEIKGLAQRTIIQ